MPKNSICGSVRETGILVDKPTCVRCPARKTENIAAATESVFESPKTSIRHHSQQLDTQRPSVLRILLNDRAIDHSTFRRLS